MKSILFKIVTFYKTYKKKIITIVLSCVLAIIAIIAVASGILYSKANSNIKYTQEQLQQVALGKVPGEVVEVNKELNLKNQSFQYEFKIKDKDNMLEEVVVNSKYGTISAKNNGDHNKENKDSHNKDDSRHGKH